MSEDFCIAHGFEHMRREFGNPIGHCMECERERNRPGEMNESRSQLNGSEWDLLRWLAQEDFSQYGECYGKDLDSLVAKGLAQIHKGTGRRNTFIAKGDGPMFEQVSLTDQGHEVLRERSSDVGTKTP